MASPSGSSTSASVPINELGRSSCPVAARSQSSESGPPMPSPDLFDRDFSQYLDQSSHPPRQSTADNMDNLATTFDACSMQSEGPGLDNTVAGQQSIDARSSTRAPAILAASSPTPAAQSAEVVPGANDFMTLHTPLDPAQETSSTWSSPHDATHGVLQPPSLGSSVPQYSRHVAQASVRPQESAGSASSRSRNNSRMAAPFEARNSPLAYGSHSEQSGTGHDQARRESRSSRDFLLPRWQQDAEVTYCPICQTQFSIFVRKHHCRKCGRVVCNSCSPHRIIIPHQYIVRPPGYETSSTATSALLDGLGMGYVDANGQSGGERVRLCNPCVPDPNTAPPQSPSPSASSSSSSRPVAHNRSRSNQTSPYGASHTPSRYEALVTAGRAGEAYQYCSPRWRSATMGSTHGSSAGPPIRYGMGNNYQSSIDRLVAADLSSSSSPSPSTSRRHRRLMAENASSSRQRALPPAPQIAEEDECPICHRELPRRQLPDFEALRESHITMCIQSHSTYSTPRAIDGEAAPRPPPRRTGMYTYAATEKDCIDDAECTICLEEFTVGVSMARLECLCRFHKGCISAWFVNHPGRCPVHQHDGFGF
ncbi:hypothetical protein CDD81_6352 [Ophiocordyceps australis]|uniref:RING-type E3 ubiquitin transferase n=1 Tax=Ophiocordyceps australis TaxID=1399860 RepID=A0A2C5Y815_9HYPO|nr:hypothetical protein CDD81_6352 [Ophiocordyceps australis]